MVSEAIVLAGGLGSRLRSAVSGVPKPMALIRERPFLEYLIDYWIDQGIRRFILSVGYLHEVISRHFGATYRGADIDYSVETAPLGTGGALLQALRVVGTRDPVLLLNGDTYFAVDLRRLSDFAGENDADVAFALFETDDRVRYMGTEVDAGGHIVNLQGTNNSPHLANGGVYWLKPAAFADESQDRGQPVSLEADILPSLLRSGRRFFGLAFQGTFIDIGVPQDFRRAQDLVLTHAGIGHAAR